MKPFPITSPQATKLKINTPRIFHHRPFSNSTQLNSERSNYLFNLKCRMQTEPRHSWRAKMKVGIGNPGSLSKTRQYLIEAQPYTEIKRERDGESTACK